MEHVLIAGGTGLIGKALTKLLLSKGYRVSVLSRRVNQNSTSVAYVHWDPKAGTIDNKAFHDVDVLINLAGEGIADQRWTKQRKRSLLESRIQAAATLFNALKNQNHNIKYYLGASAIGYYGNHPTKVFTESDESSGDFLGNTCKAWENAHFEISSLDIPVGIIRIGLVMSNKGGMFPKIALPIRFGIGSAFGSGKQGMSWIQLDDLAELFLHALTKKVQGVLNGVAPKPIAQATLFKLSAQSFKKPYFLPNIPSIIIKFLLGEMSILLLEGSYCSADKAIKSGFVFKNQTFTIPND